MGHVPLLYRAIIKSAVRLIPAICITASLIGAGFVFFGGAFTGAAEKQVTLDYGDLSGNYFTTAKTVGGFLEEIGVDFTSDDRVEPSPETRIRGGMAILFVKAKQVYLSDAGKPETPVRCSGDTVCDLINMLGLEINSLDRIEPHPSTPLENEMHVVVDRVEVIDITSMEDIEPPLVIEPDPELPRGRMVETSPGEPGLAEEVIRHYYLNGSETTSVELGSRTIKEPEARQARVGVRSMPPLASRGGFDRSQFGAVMEMDVTAYDPGPGSCGASADGRTATGHIAGRGVCAVDPSVIPLGTELWVEGYGYALACDTGGAIKGMRVDVCFDTSAEAMRWGRRDVLVYILE